MTSQSNWIHYNWTDITTLALFTDFNTELMCFAHSKGVRVVIHGDYPIANLTSADQRQRWVAAQLKTVQDNFADGINIDIEGPTVNGTNQSALLTELVKETYTAFKDANSNYQVTFDVAWSPNCIDGRCYQYDEIAKYTDFLVIMAYDERSQIFGACIASANSALPSTAYGIDQYFKLGITASQLVLGVPWYGYDYPCLSVSDHDVCMIPKVPFRGVNCSDAAGTQVSYPWIMEEIRKSTARVRWNATLESPYFMYKNRETLQMHQVWYDNPDSLDLKFIYASSKNLRGLAVWNFDQLDYSDSPRAKVEAQEMWDTFAVFFR